MLDSRHQKPKIHQKIHRNNFLQAITRKGLRATGSLPTIVHKSSAHTDVIRDSSHVSYPLVSQRTCQPLVVLHRASVSRYSLRPTNSRHQVPQCVQDSSVALPRIEDHSHLSFPLLSLVLTILFATNRQPLVSIQHQAVPVPQLLQSVGRHWLCLQVCAILCG